MLACEQDDSCFGFTLTVSGAAEVAGCLVGTGFTSGASTSSTLFVKSTASHKCIVNTLKATNVKIQIADALPNARYTISGASSGFSHTCNVSALSAASSDESACFSFVTCYDGAIASSETELTVTLSSFGSTQSVKAPKCTSTATNVIFSFTERSTKFETTAPSCFSSATPDSGCTSVTESVPTCSTSRAYTGIDLSTSSVTHCSLDSNGNTPAIFSVANNPKNIFIVADLSALSTAAQISGGVTVSVRTNSSSTKNEFPLGFIFTNSSGAIYSFMKGHRSVKAASLCTEPSTDQYSSQKLNAAVFAIPAEARNQVVTKVVITGAPGTSSSGSAKILRVASLDPTTCSSTASYPVFAEPYDIVYKQAEQRVTFDSSSVSPYSTISSGVADVGSCADLCFQEGSKCRAWNFQSADGDSTGSCSFYASTGRAARPTSSTAQRSAIGIRQEGFAVSSWPTFLGKTLPNSGSSAVLFALNPSVGRNRISFSISNAKSLRVFLNDANFQNTGTQIGVSSALGVQMCGAASSPFLPNLPSSNCAAEVLACRPLGIATKQGVSGPVHIDPLLPPSSSNTTSSWQCSSVAGGPAIWGAAYVDSGKIATILYSDLTLLSSGSSFTPSGGSTFWNDEVETGITIDGSAGYKIQRTTPLAFLATDPPKLDTYTSVVCDVQDLFSYEGLMSSEGASSQTYLCPSTSYSLSQAMQKCNDDGDKCAGFSMRNNDDNVLCFYTTAPTGSNIGSRAGYTFWKKPYAGGGPSCKFLVDAPGQINIRTTLRAMGYDEGEVMILVDGAILKRCGDQLPFLTGTTTQNFAACSTFRTCYQGPIFASSGSVVEIRFRRFKLTNDRGSCRTAYTALVDFTPALGDHQLLMKGAAQALHMRHWLQVPEATTSITINGYSITSFISLSMQDRFACGVGCPVFYFETLIDDDITTRSRCGGTGKFFGAQDGLSNRCDRSYPCGIATLKNGVYLPQDYPTPANGGKFLKYTWTDSASLPDLNCIGAAVTKTSSDRFVVLMSNGITVGGMQGASDIRFNLMVRGESSDTNLPNLTEARIFSLVKKSYPAIDLYDLHDEYFKVNSFNDATPSFAYYPFFNRGTPSDGTSFVLTKDVQGAVCIVPKTFDGETRGIASCTSRISATWVKVTVAQTSFNGFTQTVSIRMGTRRFTCGGDFRFFGFAGVASKCNSYYTCYDGPVYDDMITVSFSADVDGATCDYRAIAIVEPSNLAVPAQTSCTDANPFVCEIKGTCLSLNQVCDGKTDCPDASDEGACSNWNFVKSFTMPSCDPIKNATLSSSTMCQRLALSTSATAFTFAADTKLCRVYDCISFDNPNLVDTSNLTTNKVSDLYIQTSDPDAFKTCTAALHCSNAGRPTNLIPPCSCVCDSLYVGNRCDGVRTLNAIGNVFVVFPSGISITSSVLSSIQTAFTNNLVAADSTVLVRTIVALADGGNAVRVDITTSRGKQSEDVFNVLENSTRTKILDNLVSLGATLVTATPVVGDISSVTCNIQNLTLSTPPIYCTSKTNINKTKSITVTATSVSISNATNQWMKVRLYDTDPGTRRSRLGAVLPSSREAFAQAVPLATVICNTTNFVRTVNPTLSGACGVSNDCQVFVASSSSAAPSGLYTEVEVSKDFNPSSTTCQGRDVESSVSVEGFVDLFDSMTTGPVTFSTQPDTSLLNAAVAMFVISFIFLALCIVYFAIIKPKCRNEEEKDGCLDNNEWLLYTGSVSFCIFFVCVFLGGILYALYVGSVETTYTHMLLLEEYRDVQCNSSQLASLPIRAGYVQVDGRCNQVNFVGTAQGASFIAVKAVNGDDTTVSYRTGGSVDACSAAPWQTLNLRTCITQTAIYPLKAPLYQQYLKAFLQPIATTTVRVASLRVYNPVPQLNSSTTVDPLPDNERYSASSGRHIYQTQNQFFNVSVPQRSIGQFHVVINGSDVDFKVAFNETDRQRVRFNAIYQPTGEEVNSLPRLASGIDGDFTNAGTFFNDYNPIQVHAAGFHDLQDVSRSVISPYRDAYRYNGVSNTEWDFGLLDSRFTISFWMSATVQTRGFALAVSDNWQSKPSQATGSGGEIPPLTRLNDVLENGGDTTDWFSDWVVQGAVYVHGPSRTIRFVSANKGEPVQQVIWDTANLNVERVFDGRWHYISLVFDRTDNDVSVDALLVVDGETSYNKQGWRKCLQSHIPQFRPLGVGDSVDVLNSRNEIVVPGGLLTVGHFNGGLWGVNCQRGVLPIQKLIGLGAPGMELFGNLETVGSLALGIVMMVITFFILFYSIYEVWHHYFGVDVNRLLLENEVASKKDHNGKALRDGFPDDVSTPTLIVLVHFVTPVVGTAQNMALYFDGWNWPDRVVTFYNVFYKILVLDPFNNIEGFPTLLVPVLLFCIAIAVLFGINFLAVQDEDTFETVCNEYKMRQEVQDPFKWKEKEIGRPKPMYHWVVYDAEENENVLTAEQEEELQKELNELITHVERRQQNAGVHSNKMVKIPGIGEGILMYERRAGRIGVSLRIAPDPSLFYKQQKEIGERDAMLRHIYGNEEDEEDGGSPADSSYYSSSRFSPRESATASTVKPEGVSATAAASAAAGVGAGASANAREQFIATFKDPTRRVLNNNNNEKKTTITSADANSAAAAAAGGGGGGSSSSSKSSGGRVKSLDNENVELGEKKPKKDAVLDGTLSGTTNSKTGAPGEASGEAGGTVIKFNLVPNKEERSQSAKAAVGDPDKILVTQLTFECKTNNYVCPLHNQRLVRSALEGLSCVHSPSPFYGTVACASHTEMYQCPGVEKTASSGKEGEEKEKEEEEEEEEQEEQQQQQQKEAGAEEAGEGEEVVKKPKKNKKKNKKKKSGDGDPEREECFYAVCSQCFHEHKGVTMSSAWAEAMASLEELKRKGIWRILKTAVILSALVLYLPVVRNAAMVLFCHPFFLCEFGKCWDEPSVVFIVFVFIAIASVSLVGVGYIAQQTYLLSHRFDSMKELLPTFPIYRKYNCWLLPQTNIMPRDYDRFLFVDDSLLKTLYEPHSFTMFWFTPAWLVAKAAVIIALVASTPNSLEQLAVVSSVEAFYSLSVTFLSPYKNKWVNTVARMSLLWMMLSLALMALHRYEIAQDVNSAGYAEQMIALAIVFWSLVGVVVFAAILEPWYDAKQRERIRIKELGDINGEIEKQMALKREQRQAAAAAK